MSAPELIGLIQPSAQTQLPSPAQPWPRARWCGKTNSEIPLYSAWNFPPLHARFGSEIGVNYGPAWTPGRRKLEGSLLSRTDSLGVSGRKLGKYTLRRSQPFHACGWRPVSDR